MIMENTNLSEEAIKLKELEAQILETESNISHYENYLIVANLRLEKLKERKKSLLNYLNTDNN